MREGFFQDVRILFVYGTQNDLGIKYAARAALDDLVVILAMSDGCPEHGVDVDTVAHPHHGIGKLDIIEGDGALTFSLALLCIGCALVHAAKEDLCSTRLIRLDEAAQRTRK